MKLAAIDSLPKLLDTIKKDKINILVKSVITLLADINIEIKAKICK